MTKRSGGLDGLRGLAALAVVISHLNVCIGVLPFSRGGFIGVVVFFALSGYLIAGILWRAPATLASYRRFLVRRVQRLAPVILALVVVGVPTLVAFSGQELRSALVEAALVLTQTMAFAVMWGMEGNPGWLHTWSLTVEWVFYLAFPLLLIGLRVRGLSPRRIRLALAALAAALYLGGLLLSPRAFYLSPVANVAVMVVGGILALHHADPAVEHRRPDPARATFALILLALLVASPTASLSPAYRFIVFPAVTVATLVVMHECRHPGRVGRALGWRPLALVGTAAYSLYIWHMPVMWLTYLAVPDLPRPVIGLIALVLVVPVVTASYWFLERPVLRHRPTPAAAGVGQPPLSQPVPTSLPVPTSQPVPTS